MGTENAQQWAQLRRRLEAERQRLSEELADDQSNDPATPGMATSDHAQWETSGYGNHIADDATELFLQEEEMTIDLSLRAMLDEVEHALQRMDEGTYGKCERCGKEIPPRRLEARPFSTLCVECKALEERSIAQAQQRAAARRTIG
jgi:RNA polymerase-binding protein DksA